MRHRLFRILLLSSLLGAFVFVTLPQQAGAEIEGDCEAYIDGQDVRDHDSSDPGDAIEVDPDSPVPVEISAFPSTRNKIQLEFIGWRWTVLDEEHSEAEFDWSDDFPVDEYRKFGVGFYKIVWEGSGDEGTCRASALIRVPGSPLTSVAGGVAAGAIAIGLVGLSLSLRFTFNAGQRWAIKLTASGEVERDERKRRWRLRPSFSLSGTVSGVLTGMGIFTLLQEAAVRPPTVELSLELILPLTLIGVLILPALGFNLGARRGLTQSRS